MRIPVVRLGAVLAAAALLLATSPGAPVVAAAGPVVAAAGSCAAADSQDPRPHCCFTSPRYVGACEVEPEKGETCTSILEYLNNPQSQGKAYCNRTAIRGDWKLVPCEPEMKRD